MTHPGVDLSAIGSENRRITHAGIPAGPVLSDRVRPVAVLVRKKPYRFQLWFNDLSKTNRQMIIIFFSNDNSI
jgi:hypothetical protein